MSRLDRSRSFGTVSGMGPKHAFEQDGKVFDCEGEEVRPAKADKGETTPSAPAEAKPLHTIGTKDGNVVLDGMEPEALHKLAADLGVKVHPQSGAKKVMDALVKALPPTPAAPDQVSEQLNG